MVDVSIHLLFHLSFSETLLRTLGPAERVADHTAYGLQLTDSGMSLLTAGQPASLRVELQNEASRLEVGKEVERLCRWGHLGHGVPL